MPPAFQSFHGLLRRQLSNFRKSEHPLRVRLRPSHPAPQLGQPGTNQDDRQRLLGHLVQRGDQAGKLLLFDVLQLVDKNDERGLGCLSGTSCRLHEHAKIRLKVPGVRQPALRFAIKQTNLDVFVLETYGANKPGKRCQGGSRLRLRLLDVGQFDHRCPEVRDDLGRERGGLFGLDPDRLEPGRLRFALDSIQKHGFPNAAQANDEDALRR